MKVDQLARPESARIGQAEVAGHWVRWDREVFGDDPDLKTLAALADPAGALETVHWGRNYLWRASTRDQSGVPIEVVVKQFRHDAMRAAWRRRLEGSKALKSWRMAWALVERGLPTPDPLVLVEALDARGPCAFVSRRLEGLEEVRYSFRRWNAGADTVPPATVLLPGIARLARRLHDAGVWHRDFSAGNVLTAAGAGADPVFSIVDLNRARLRQVVTPTQRMRDLGRLPAHRPEHRDLLRQAYFAPASVTALDRWRHEWFYRNFHGRHRLKQRLRGGVGGSVHAGQEPVKGRGWLGLIKPRSSYPHLAPAPAGAATRDQTVWDPLSDQPHHHASPLAKLLVRVADGADHLRTVGSAAVGLPRVLARTRALLAAPRIATLDGLGIAVRPQPDLHLLLEGIAELGCHHVLVRVHPWEQDHQDEVRLVAELATRGHEVAVALPQNRELVRDRGKWRAAVTELADQLGPYARVFQIGQAINRSKWGVWTLGEYLELAADAAAILRERIPQVQIVGPAVIDFEPHTTIAAVRRRHGDLRFDALGSLLYVDRRGAPENPQLGLDAEGKAAFMLAIAQTARSCAPRSWITEVNWPLREGPHSPAGRSVSVDEQSQANYLVRFMLLTHGSGFAERVYWWQLVAKGYGLIDPPAAQPAADLGRRRPAFLAYSTLLRQLGGARRLGAIEGPGVRALVFERADATQVACAWAPSGRATLDLGWEPARLVGQHGEALVADGPRLELGAAVIYAELPVNAAIRS